jgi:hypothetical protein
VPTGYDKDRSFLSIEISGDHVYFPAISRTGVTVDSRTIRRRQWSSSPSRSPWNPGPVTAKGLGEKMPVADNRTVAGRQMNCRVEVVALGAILGTTVRGVRTWSSAVTRQ